jgi:3-dehydroquinate dehydratase/shikimate dehydrogenase
MAQVCLVLTGPLVQDCLRQLDKYRPHIDLAEVRADLLDRSEWSRLNGFSQRAGLPLILTLRQPRDGGRWEGPAPEREALFRNAFDGAWAWLDIEDDQRLPDLERQWLALGRRLVVSFHDLNGVPEGWSQRLAANQGPGLVAKAAVFPRSSADYLRFLSDLQALPPGDRVALAMGEFGFSSRVLAARLGSLWTYSSSKDEAPAPGLIDPETLQTLYRFREQTAQTPVYGIVGNPVFHSKSPVIHNPGFARLGLPGTYVPFRADDLDAFFATCDKLGVRGLSCTIPFKEAVVPHLSERTPAVDAARACNTLWREAGGPWKGDNTDAPGFLVPLADICSRELAGLRATVVGTGGAARGILWALREEGVKVLVLGRSPDKAQSLALEFGAEWGPLGAESRPGVEDHADLIVQTTSVGMGDTAGQDPLAWYEFTGQEIAYDVIYAPKWTAFLTRAQKAGCRLLFGEDMLVNQAFGQFRRFTGQEYPREVLSL